MTTRKRNTDTPGLVDLEGVTSPETVSGFMPPPGVEGAFEHKVRFTRMITPADSPEQFSNELRELAGEEIENLPLPEPPSDPLSDFCYTWKNFTGFNLHVTRLPDPINKRAPGQTYNSTCWEVTALGTMPFDPASLVPQLQVANGNSGGVFRLFLIDESGAPIPGARLDRILVPDPPKSYPPNDRRYYAETLPHYYEQRQQSQQQPATPPQKSENELFMEQVQRDLFQKALARALEPPVPPPSDPFANMPERDRLALGLLKEGDMLSSIVERISNLAQAPEKLESATWKDKLADASIQLVTNNPQVVATATDILSRLVMAIATAFAPRTQQSTVINTSLPVQHAPGQRAPIVQLPQIPSLPPSPPAPQSVNGLPETPQPEDETLDNQEDVEIDMMEEIVKLLLSERPLSLDDPALTDIREDYPAIFTTAMTGLAAYSTMQVIQYLCSKSDFCADLFNSQRNGTYLRQRLEEFKQLLIAPATTSNATPANNTEKGDSSE